MLLIIRLTHGHERTHTHTHIYIYISSYNDWCLYSSIACNKAFIRWWLWVQKWFQSQNIITIWAPEQYLMTLPDFVRLLSLYRIAKSMLMQLEPYLFLCISSCLMEKVQNAGVELVMKPQHPTSIGNTLVIQPFLTNCSRKSSYFSNLWNFLQKVALTQWLTFF